MAEIVPKAVRDNVRSITGAGDYVDHATRESSSEDDAFTLVTARGYRPDRFYTRSLNADGHGERMTIRVPLGLDSQIHEQVAKIPYYRSHQDFFRDAALHRLEYLQRDYDLSDEATEFCREERYEADNERREQARIQMGGKVAGIEQRLQAQWDAQDYSMMDEELDSAKAELEMTRDPYRRQIAEAIDKWDKRAREHIDRHTAEREDR